MPAPLCHIACVCMHAYDSCVIEFQSNACLFLMKRKRKIGAECKTIWLKKMETMVTQTAEILCVCVCFMNASDSLCVYYTFIVQASAPWSIHYFSSEEVIIGIILEPSWINDAPLCSHPKKFGRKFLKLTLACLGVSTERCEF